MIEFQEFIDEIQLLENEITEQFKLLRALANFHINGNAEDTENNRLQIVKSLKNLESNYTKLVESWKKLNTDLKSQVAYEPDIDSHSELITKFIKIAVPIEMQTAWRASSFSGSLLVFFENGKIISSSLIEKKIRPGQDEDREKLLSINEVNGVEQSLRVVQEPKENFKIVKSTRDAKINIYFSLKKPGSVILLIYNKLDQFVHQIEKKYDRPGEYTIVWDGCDDKGDALSKDSYYCQLQIGSSISEIKNIELS